jgi:hypothetical protein
MNFLKDIENDAYNLEGLVYRNGEDYLQSLNKAIVDAKSKMTDHSFIKEWFESPYVSDYDKKLAKEYIKTLKP